MDIGRPFEFRSVCVTCADVSSLQCFELLLRAEFIGLGVLVMVEYTESVGSTMIESGTLRSANC